MTGKIIKNMLSTAVIFLSVATSGFASAKDISQEQLQKIMNSDKPALLLDVRKVSEFNDGHIPKAINIPHGELQSRLSELSADKDIQIVLYCRSGKRAEVARKILAKNGYKKLDHLNGDFNGWSGNNLPITKGQL